MSLLGGAKQWFRVEPHERPWVIAISGAAFFLTAANVLLWTLLQVLLIKRAGVEYFPAMMVASSLALFAGAWVTLRLFPSWRAHRQSAFFAVASLATTLCLALLNRFLTHETPPYIILTFVALGVFSNSALIVVASDKLFVLASDVFNVEQMQRFQPILTSVATVSSLLSGLLLALLSERLSTDVLFVCVVGLIACATPFYLLLERTASASSLLPPILQEADAGKVRGFKQQFPDPVLRRFIILLGIVSGLSMVFTRIFNYELAIISNSTFPTEAALNAFNGWYTVATSIGILVFINTIQRYLFARYGLTKNNYVPPLVVLAGVIGMIWLPIFPVVVTVVFAREIIISLQQSSWAIMLEGVSDAVRNRAWSWLNGPVVMLGGLLGSVVMLAVTFAFPNADVATMVRVLGLCAAVFLLLRLAFDTYIRRIYPSVLLYSLESGDFKTRLRTVEAMSELRFMQDRHLGALLDIVRSEAEPISLRVEALQTVAAIRDASSLRVVSRLLPHANVELRLSAVRTVAAFRYQPDRLYESGFSRFVLIGKLREAFASEKSQEVVDAILDALIALRDPEIVPFIITCLQNGSASIKRAALRSLRQFSDPALIDYVMPFLSHPSVNFRAQALAALWQFPWERDRHLKEMLTDMLNAIPASEEFRQGMYLVGRLRLTEHQPTLVTALAAEEPDTRLMAAVSLLKLGTETGAPELERALETGSEEEAYRVERLATHPSVPAPQRIMVQRLIHTYHLHYPANLPVSEALRVRPCMIPRECLLALRAYYQAPEARPDLAKIERALRLNITFPAPTGMALLAGLETSVRESFAVAILAHGYEVRFAKTATSAERGDMVIGMEGLKLPARAFVLTSRTEGLGPREVALHHAAPSEVIALFKNPSETK